MSSSFFNKVAGAIILVALTLVVISTIGNALMRPTDTGKSVVAVAKAPAKQDPAPAEPSVPIGALLKTVDAAAGEKEFNKCKTCHTTENGGKNKIGPNLWNIVNRSAASRDGFSYSDALAEKGVKWTYDNLDAFLTKPKDFVPGTKMAFAGVKKAKDRAELIAYLRSLSESPAPLP